MTPSELRSPLPIGPSRRLRAALAHRRLRRTLAGLSFTLLPAVWLASALLPSPAGPLAALGTWLAAWAVLVVALARFPCPTCGRRVHWGPVLDLFGTRCVNCGVSLDP